MWLVVSRDIATSRRAQETSTQACNFVSSTFIDQSPSSSSFTCTDKL